jgi:hypothetical protein
MNVNDVKNPLMPKSWLLSHCHAESEDSTAKMSCENITSFSNE